MNGFGLKKKRRSNHNTTAIHKNRKEAHCQLESFLGNKLPLILLSASLSSELSVETEKQDSYGSWQQTYLATASS